MLLKLRIKFSILVLVLFFAVALGSYFYLQSSMQSSLLHPLDETIAHILNKHLGFLLISGALAAAIVSIFFVVGVVRPLMVIHTRIQKLGEGDFSSSFRGGLNDEWLQLAHSLIFMAEQIKTKLDEAIKSRVRLEAVFLSMFDGIVILDDQGNIVLMNQTLKEVLRVNQNPLGRKPLEIIRNIEIQDMADNVLKQKSGVETRELSVLLPEERILMVHATAVARDNRVDGAVMVFHDITDLRKLERIRREFVANVSHELRTPVATIKGYAETLLEGALNDRKHARDFVEIIHSDAARLARLINDLLDLSQIESGKMKLNLKLHPLGPIVDRVIAAMTKKAQEKSITIKKDIPIDLPAIRADETSIAQVLLNLIENAIKYNKLCGTVTISAYSQNGFVVIDVSDTGIGIPPEDLPRIFERFYRVDKGRSRQMGGTGLGLAIVKHMVQAHHGDLWVKSVLEQGSTFSLSLPSA